MPEAEVPAFRFEVMVSHVEIRVSQAEAARPLAEVTVFCAGARAPQVEVTVPQTGMMAALFEVLVAHMEGMMTPV